MSIFPRKLHGPELKCGGPQMCSDCRERVRLAQEYGNLNPFEDWFTADDKTQAEELLKTLDSAPKKPKDQE